MKDNMHNINNKTKLHYAQKAVHNLLIKVIVLIHVYNKYIELMEKINYVQNNVIAKNSMQQKTQLHNV